MGGLIEYEKARADELAGMGYVVFALDVYGKGVRCKDEDCAVANMKKAQSNATKLRRLLSAGTSELVAAAGQKDKLVALGYCFGGGNVLELARHPGVGASEGVVFKAVSSVHGTLSPLVEPAAAGEVKTWVQAHHAEFDFQGDQVLVDLQKELSSGTNGTDAIWEAVKYAKC